MTKIVIIGAGSGFGGRLSVDIMSRESLRDATISIRSPSLRSTTRGNSSGTRRFAPRSITSTRRWAYWATSSMFDSTRRSGAFSATTRV